jgi:NADPH2:quinone reductase
VSELGGPEVLEWVEVPDPEPGPGDLLVEIDAVGVNYVETYHRTGIYGMEPPFIPGGEGAGRVVHAGAETHDFAPGDLVVSQGLRGSYAEKALVAADRAVPVPEGVDAEMAAALLLQGMTAYYLCHDSYPLAADSVCLIHAGAGGVGRLLIQMAKQIGATVFTTVSTGEKAELARSAGADHIINYVDESFATAVERIAGARPLDVVFDGVGTATFDDGLTLLRPRGTMVLFGQSSGVVPPFNLGRLASEGSLYVTRPTLHTHVADPDELQSRAAAVFDQVLAGTLEINMGNRYPLCDAAQAHTDLQARLTSGKNLLIP